MSGAAILLATLACAPVARPASTIDIDSGGRAYNNEWC